MVSLNVNKNIYRSNWKPSPIIGQLKKKIINIEVGALNICLDKISVWTSLITDFFLTVRNRFNIS